MPKEQQKQVTPRQRPVSCRFCRSRKLRCSREAPCSNCVSRGVHCQLEDPIGPSGGSANVAEPDILQRLEKLEKLFDAQRSEQEVGLEKTPQRQRSESVQSLREWASPSTLSSQIQGLDNDVAWLESIYTDQNLSRHKIPSPRIVFRICPIQQVTGAQLYVFQHELHSTASIQPSRCIWLPRYAEAQILLEKFISDVHHLPYVTHVPSLPSMFEQVYTDLNQQHQMKPGQVILLLSIFASATYSWLRGDCERGLFSTPSEANKQASWWIKATQDVVDIAHRTSNVSIEGVQGILLVSFVLALLEGMSRRCRSSFSTAVLLARDLGLHRIDHPSNADRANTAQAEMGRRAWWYMCASEWSLAARLNGVTEGVYSCHPRQMITRKPLHVNDEEVFDGMTRAERPLSQPTKMSYSLHRIRLAEISRNIVDRTPLTMTYLGGPSRDDVMDIDTELQMLINDIPPFFSMSEAKLIETYEVSRTQAVDIMTQGHTLYFLLYAQRCKLHLPYLTRGFVDTTYSSLREICIKSARLSIQSQSYLLNSGLGPSSRLNCAGLLGGVFMASIVLLMDLCVNRSPQREDQRGEIVEAFRILEEAKQESETTSKFVDSLMFILRKHKVTPPKCTLAQQFLVESGKRQLGATPSDGNDTSTSQAYGAVTKDLPYGASSGACKMDEIGSTNISVNEFSGGDEMSSYFDELAQSLEHGDDLGNFDWNNIFSGLDSSLI